MYQEHKHMKKATTWHIIKKYSKPLIQRKCQKQSDDGQFLARNNASEKKDSGATSLKY